MTDPTLKKIAHDLFDHQLGYGDTPRITMNEARDVLESIMGLLFPQLSKANTETKDDMEQALLKVREDVSILINKVCTKCIDEVDVFFGHLPKIAKDVKLDVEAILEGDPAAKSLSEIIVTYPGCYAIASHRIAHEFYKMDVPIIPRLFSEHSHRATGVDIHPGAKIGKSFFIDHATGVVIGETAVIGNNVKLYQGVTLGALTVSKGQRNKKRHPTLEDNVVVYANATILGGNTVVGNDTIVGGNVWLTKSVIPYSRVMYQSSDSSESGLNWTI